MIYFVELWNVKPAWTNLSREQRAEYVNQVKIHVGNLLNNGVKVLTWSKNEDRSSNRAAYDYIAIWTCRDQETLQNLQNLVEGAGWYNYFEQVNAAGIEDSAENILREFVEM